MEHVKKSFIGMSLFAAALLAAAIVAIAWANGPVGQAVQVQQVEIDRSGADHASIELRPEVARLLLRSASADQERLLSGTIETRLGDDLHQSAVGTSVRDVALRTTSGPGIHLGATGPVWQLDLAQGVPTDLDIHAQVGRLDLDLRGSDVTTLNVRTETGRARVHAPRGDVSGAIATKLGDIVVYVPRDANATITVRRFLGVTNAHRDFARDGRSYRLDGTGPTIDLLVENTAGTVTLETY